MKRGMNMSGVVVSLYKESRIPNIVLDDSYLDFLAEEFKDKKNLPFENMNFEQWVDYNLSRAK